VEDFTHLVKKSLEPSLVHVEDSPKAIEVHFVDSKEDPTGLGEPYFPPVFAALANSLYKATGKRFYQQPFGPQLEKEGLKV
jgi:isoquinoline 1-oxidoreductase beta subunit